MADILLLTKLFIPPQRPFLIPRPRVVEKAEKGLNKKLILVTAPAGYGKTTFVADWLRPLQASGNRLVAWFSLDETDNDPARFLTYLVAAIHRAVADDHWGEGVNLLLQAAETPVQTAVSLLINETTLLDKPLLLVLDDYHLIQHDGIHQALTTILDHQPPTLTLILTTRVDPPLPLARLRLRGELHEIDAADLRFSLAETADFFRLQNNISLTPEQVATLDAQAEGWAAGLQAAALSLRPDQDVNQFLVSFRGRQRFVLDYLAEEVYRRQPAAIQSFLRQTAVCDRICAPLCEQLVGQVNWNTEPAVPQEPTSVQAVLEYLDTANLFIVPLDNQRRWYRYHTLFRDFLQSQLAQMEPEALPELQRRAADWFANNGLPDEAIRHRLAAGDTAEAAALITGIARRTLSRGEGVTLQRWLDALPPEIVQASPRLCLAQATLLTFVRDIEGVQTYLHAAETAVKQSADLPTSEINYVLGGAAVYRAMLALWQGDVAQTAQLCQEALKRLQADDSYLSGLASLLLGMTQQAHNLEQASESFARALTVGQKTSDMMLVNTAIGSLAGITIEQGKLHEAAALYRQAITLVSDQQGRPFPVAAGALLGLAQITLEWNQLEEAEKYLAEAVILARQANLPNALLEAKFTEVQLHMARRAWSPALDALAEGETMVRAHFQPEMAQRLAMIKARLTLVRGQLDEALAWANNCGLTLTAEPAVGDEMRYLEFIRLLLAQAQAEGNRPISPQIMQRLSQIKERAVANGRVQQEIAVLILQTLVYDKQQATDAALSTLKLALTLAQPGGYIRLFAAEGDTLAHLLPALARTASGAEADNIGRLLQTIKAPPAANDLLVEPLTERELEILRLIVAGLPNQEIADSLVIALSTVKRHINHIYGKLAVNSRSQAIAKTHELHLLP